jgi:hypothetical protein
MAVINEKLNPSADGQRSKLRYFQKQLRYPSYFWIFQQLLHPVVFALILPSYNIYIGKVILWLLFKLHLVTKPVIAEELSGDKPSFFPAKFPNALAQILLLQLKKLDKYNELRRENAAYYYQQLKKKKNIKLPKLNHEGIYLRFNILTERAADILQKAKQHRILLGNWYKNTIDPKGVNLSKIGYRKDSCPKAEAAAKLSVNLPTYSRLTKADLDAVVNML